MPPIDENNLVAPADACPICGERSADRLVWIDDDQVLCSMCGCEYEPRSEAAHVE